MIVMGKIPTLRSTDEVMDLVKAYTRLDTLCLVVGLHRTGFLFCSTWRTTKMNNWFYLSRWKALGKGRCTHSRVGIVVLTRWYRLLEN